MVFAEDSLTLLNNEKGGGFSWLLVISGLGYWNLGGLNLDVAPVCGPGSIRVHYLISPTIILLRVHSTRLYSNNFFRRIESLEVPMVKRITREM